MVDMAVYLTGTAHYLPGEPLDHIQIADRLGADARSRLLGSKVLAANGIRTRHYALDEHGQPTMLNEELAAEAVSRALKDSGVDVDDVGLLATGTTQGDVLVPGFASMVHGRLGAFPMELLSAGGVCASSMAAFIAADRAVRCGDHATAVVVGSELVSRALRQSRYRSKKGFDAEFLRWTLSDGAGAVVLQNAPKPGGLSFRVDWTHLVSHAGTQPTCMYAGLTDGGKPTAGQTWLDQPDATAADAQGMFWLRQDVKVLPDLFHLGLRDFMGLVRDGRFQPSEVDHVLCHYSAEHFRADIFQLLTEGRLDKGATAQPDRPTDPPSTSLGSWQSLMIPEERWYTNLHERGNTGAASIFVMLAEAVAEGRFAPGDRILLIVPESGRFTLSFAHLTCVAGSAPAELDAGKPARSESPLGVPPDDDAEPVRFTLLELTRVWGDFERQVRATAPVRRIESGRATVADYQRLLLNLRQQVVDGGRWISRAASNFSVDLFELRSAAIKHAADEHRDYQLLERDYCAVGGSLADIQRGVPNVGSRALSAFVFHQASQPDPVDLLGAMFIIEGLGTALAMGWARQLQSQLGLRDDQVSFLRYHGEADDEHFAELAHLLRTAVPDRATGERIVRTAEVVARLYALQLEEVA
jgi:3-oxoacyl-[acyl-carrier-protein] synthase III